jgi:protein-disulfide isomerase
MAISQGKSPKKASSSKKSKEGDKTTRNIAIGMVVFVLATAGIFAFMNSQASKKLTIPSSVSKADGYAIVVNPTAPVRVDFWEDFQCPNCGKFEAVSNAYFDDLVKAKKIKAVYHPMSFLGPESVLAAQAAACTADEGKFVQMHTMLYANQPSSENSGAWTNDVLIKLATAAGANKSTVSKCITSGKYVNWAQKVEDDASKKGVTSTPTVYVNGKELNRAHYLDLAALKKDLAAAGVK